MRPTGDAGVARADASVAANTSDAAVSAAAAGDAATSASGDASAPATPAAGGDAAANSEENLPPVRPREIPAPAFPAERPQNGPTIDAPTFGLVRASGNRVAGDVVRVDVSAREVFVARTGLGVTRIPTRDGAAPQDYRTHDLALQHRSLSLATDSRGNVWLVGEDGGPVRYDGRAFTRVSLEDDPQVHPLLFWTRGTTTVALARVGDRNVLRGYRLEGTQWRRALDGPVETYGDGTVDARFVAVDSRGRFWVGLRVLPPAGATGNARDLGVAVLDPQNPVTVQYNENVPPTGGQGGSKRAPNDMSAIDFDADGNAWLAGLDGATRIGTDGEVRRFRESEGVRGDLVSDLVRAVGNKIFVATPEGLGVWEQNAFSFAVEGSSQQPKASALAVDASGNLWGAGAHGAWRYDGRAFTRLGRAQGLPSEDFTDIAVDAQNRVWFANTDGLVLYDQAIRNE